MRSMQNTSRPMEITVLLIMKPAQAIKKETIPISGPVELKQI
ncbi:MAG: hypothetical protein BWY67_02453 [Bacteroidetes bacterium ADurb.Bin397]|nr:MAG: hypothetical protein BWY67_02453 [Bacteroidetes bacterium ADurb.Bin397]